MITFEKFKLDNGLIVILHEDESTPLATVNILYKVGSRNEDPGKTGFAHLFEHLMFGGSKHVSDYDIPIQESGGDNNAFTNNDITNFYNVLPGENLETALWLEADRMLYLNIDQKALDVQKKVVLEEFNETSINLPYGNLWHVLSDTAYKKHPYRWPTIGMKKEHIANAGLEDVADFFQENYNPNNAILVITGRQDIETTRNLVNKWFGEIPQGPEVVHNISTEPDQQGLRKRLLSDDVPADAIYMAFHMPGRLHKDFAAVDLLSDILSGGRSSRFYKKLLKGTTVFSNIQAYVTGTMDPGLFVIEAKLMDNATVDEARVLIWNELALLKIEKEEEHELQKVKNGLISSISFSEVSVINKAINLAYFEMLGDASMINRQEEEYNQVTTDDIQRVAKQIFRKENCSEVIYLKKEEELSLKV
ncbi:MAG: insulinase family protein [Saprospiraceae bacterium]|nr:insulinase family protein [Saprospiraceae bacterium]